MEGVEILKIRTAIGTCVAFEFVHYSTVHHDCRKLAPCFVLSNGF